MEDNGSLKELFLILRRRMVVIFAITGFIALVVGIVSYTFITPVYESSTQILVNQKKKDNSVVQFNEVQTNVQLINTYNVVIKSPAILSKVKDKLNLDMSVKALTKKISVASEKESQVLTVTVQDSSPARAAAIANTIADTFKEEIVNLMSVDNVNVLSTAEIVKGQAPVKPQPLLNIGIAIVAGLFASIGIVLLLDYLDNTIKKEQDVEKLLGLSVLGSIAQMEEKKVVDKKLAANMKVREHTIGS
ncbi:YveK family protein [Ectobacillus sp. sgz5001026]|uniref:YveK family protein n=1 Tax=Ectobacillus sp. sgz5001026 TaxID=3242473 RepID=UPI0036D30D7D